MKKRIFASLLAVLLLTFSSQVFAADMGTKIAVVDLNRAVNESAQGKKAKSELEEAIKEKQETLDEKGKAIEKLKAELQKQGPAMSAEARKSKEDELERDTRDYQRAYSDSQNDVRKKESELTGRIINEVRKVIFAIGKEEKYDLILDNNPAIIGYANKVADITDEVIKRFDASEKGK
jgi:outer membrane protein